MTKWKKYIPIYPYNNILNNYPSIYNNPFINTIPIPNVYPNIYSRNSPFNTNNLIRNIKESNNLFIPKNFKEDDYQKIIKLILMEN